MPRFRFTVRRMMIVVMAVGLVLAVGLMLERRAVYLRLAELREINWQYHEKRAEQEEREARQAIVELEKMEAREKEEGHREFDTVGFLTQYALNRARKNAANASERLEFAETLRKRAAWGRPLVSKYRRAARYPWLPVEPDPPEPK